MRYKHGKHTIEIFDSIQDLPILRFQRFNKYQMQSVEIGNTFEDYNERTIKTIQFLKKGMYQEAAQELENRQLTVFNAFNEYSPKVKAFAVLVRKIDDKDYSLFTPENLDRCIEHLERIGISNAKSIEKLKDVKKKSKRNCRRIFQTFFQKMGTWIKGR